MVVVMYNISSLSRDSYILPLAAPVAHLPQFF